MSIRWYQTMLRMGLHTALICWGLTTFASEPNKPTHKQLRTIKPTLQGSDAMLNTFCLSPKNELWMCCSSKVGTGAIVIYNGEGERLREIPMTFNPSAINFAPNGELFVAGGGKIAKLNQDGEVLQEIEAPNIGNKEEMLAQMKKAAEEQMTMILASYKEQEENIDKQIAKNEEVPEGETEKQAARRERRLKLLKQQKEQFAQIQEQVKNSVGGELNEGSLQRLTRATGLGVTSQDVFVSLPEVAGYGYSIWRLDHQLENPKAVLEKVGGCCGQLDIQCDGDNLLVAENTKFEVGIYDRDGKRLSGFGQRAGATGDGFGSCCNPMNVRCAKGEILTAESSIGDIKRFSASGEFLGYVGRASVGGGCKHVAIGFDPERDWHYMMVQDSHSVAVLVPKDQAPGESDEERLSREAMDGIAKRIFGTWELVQDEDKQKDKPTSGIQSVDNYLSQMYAHLELAPDGKLLARGLETDASALVQPNQEWQAVRDNAGKLEFVTVSQKVKGYGASVEFVGEDEAKLTWFYGSIDSPMGPAMTYKRTAKKACGQDCENCEEKKAIQ